MSKFGSYIQEAYDELIHKVTWPTWEELQQTTVIVLIALGIGIINIHPPIVLFSLFVGYALSGYVIYGWRRTKGLQTSVISTSTDEPDERGLHD